MGIMCQNQRVDSRTHTEMTNDACHPLDSILMLTVGYVTGQLAG